MCIGPESPSQLDIEPVVLVGVCCQIPLQTCSELPDTVYERMRFRLNHSHAIGL